MLASKIISGGQTGVDQAALRVAQEFHLEAGGWCPPGRVCEIGAIPYDFPLQETHDDRSHDALHTPRSQRSRFNVRDSDATLVICPPNLVDKHSGSHWTIECAKNYGRPLLIVDPDDKDASSKITSWLSNLSVHTLNIVGPRESSAPGIGEKAYSILCQVFSA